MIGGRLVGGPGNCDVESERIVGECKLRKDLGLETVMEQVEEHYRTGKICAVFSKKKGKNIRETIVSVRFPDFLALLGGEDGTDLLHDNDDQEK